MIRKLLSCFAFIFSFNFNLCPYNMAVDGRCRMFLGERWPDNGAEDPSIPQFRQTNQWGAAWNGEHTLPYWTVYRGPGGAQGASASVSRLVVRAAPLRHAVPCIGYVVDEIDAGGRMDVEKATALGLPPGKVEPGRYCSPRHRMLFTIKTRASDMRWMTWRAT